MNSATCESTVLSKNIRSVTDIHIATDQLTDVNLRFLLLCLFSSSCSPSTWLSNWLRLFGLLAFLLALSIICRRLTKKCNLLCVDFVSNHTAICPLEALTDFSQKKAEVKVVFLLFNQCAVFFKKRIDSGINLLRGDDDANTSGCIESYDIDLAFFTFFSHLSINKLEALLKLV